MENQAEKLTEEKRESWGDIVRFAIIALAIVIPFRIFIAQPYIVEGASMDPTFKDGDYLIVDQLSYRFTEPERGDVIILKYPKDTSKNFIKRLIAFPGEIVSIRSGVVSIEQTNGATITLDEPYIRFEKQEDFELALGEDEYFVMGDNRAGSSDSRAWGPLPEHDIVGQPLMRLLPFASFSVFPGRYHE